MIPKEEKKTDLRPFHLILDGVGDLRLRMPEQAKAIYMRNKTSGSIRKLPVRSQSLASSMANHGWEEVDPPTEEPRKRPRRTRDIYWTPNFQGW